MQEKESLNAHVNFGGSPDKLKSEYLDIYEGVYAEIVSSDRFDEDTDLSTTYLGQINMTRDMEVKAEENFPITSPGYTKGKLLDGTKCDILVDTGARKSYMSKSYFMRCKSLHSLPKIHLHLHQNPSWQWTVCRCSVNHTCHNDHPKSQI